MDDLRHHRSLRLATRLVAMGVGFALIASVAQAQQLSAAQKSAIKSSCRSDYMSNCMSVTPGGLEALQCLQKHMAKLSPTCQTAVNAATPKPAAAPLAAPPAAASPPPPARAAGPPPAKKTVDTATAKPAAKHVTKPAAKPETKRVTTPAAKPTAKPTAKPVAPSPPQQTAIAPPLSLTPPPPPETQMPNAPIVMTAVIGRSCLRDLVRYCRDIKVGDGRKIACLTEHSDRLTVLCKAAMKITAPIR